MKKINEILPIVTLLLVIILAGGMLSLYLKVLNMEKSAAKSMVCVPLIKEDVFGDHYFLECLDKEEFDESFEKAEDPGI